ncbi:hypothetical protein AO372_1175 [Moraxella catarrhalis]|nr:hypothetical protein AO372_1175 [Moraxella catarrhalis]
MSFLWLIGYICLINFLIIFEILSKKSNQCCLILSLIFRQLPHKIISHHAVFMLRYK